MRYNKNNQRAIDRETYRTMEEAGISMREYYMEGSQGGLVAEAIELNQYPALVAFIEKHGTIFPHDRVDGSETSFNIRLNGAEVKK